MNDELPPAFSSAERAAMPLLAREDDNPIFEAFRRRRRVHARRFRLPLPNLGSSSFAARVLQILVGVMGAIFIYGYSINTVSLLIGPLPAAILGVLAAALAITVAALVFMTAGSVSLRLKANHKFIPRHCSVVFSGQGTQNDLVMDLWMTGAGGEKIAEALFLDALDTFRRNSQRAWFAMIAVSIGVILYRLDLRLSAFVLAASLVALAWLARDILWWGKANMTRARIKALATDWEIAAGGYSVTRAAGRGFLLGLGYTALTLLGLVLFFTSVIGIGSALDALRSAQWWPLEPWEIIPIVGSLVIVIVGITAQMMIPLMLRREQRLVLIEFTHAEAAFDTYVRTNLIKDAEGEVFPKKDRAP